MICESKYIIRYPMNTFVINDPVCNANIHTVPKYFIGATYEHGPIRHPKFFAPNVYMDTLIYLPVIVPFSLLSLLLDEYLWTVIYDLAQTRIEICVFIHYTFTHSHNLVSLAMHISQTFSVISKEWSY